MLAEWVWEVLVEWVWEVLVANKDMWACAPSPPLLGTVPYTGGLINPALHGDGSPLHQDNECKRPGPPAQRERHAQADHHRHPHTAVCN